MGLSFININHRVSVQLWKVEETFKQCVNMQIMTDYNRFKINLSGK